MAEVMIKDVNGNDVKLLLSTTELIELKRSIKKGYAVEIISLAWRII